MRPRRPVDLDDLDLPRELANLERRLRDGEEKLRLAKEEGDWSDVERWETAWIRLLRQYEQLYDRLHPETDEPISSSSHGS